MAWLHLHGMWGRLAIGCLIGAAVMAPTDAGAAQKRKKSSRTLAGASRPQPSRLAAQSFVYYPNCASARAAGAAPIRAGNPGYSRKLDRDGDGVACE